MRLPIFIISYNLAWMTVNLLDSLKKCSFHEIFPIVIDNGSNPNELIAIRRKLTKDFLGSYNLVENGSNLGFVKAVNQGMHMVAGSEFPYFFIFNNDTLVTKDWDKNLVESLEKEGTGIVGPMTSPPNWRDVPSAQIMIKNKLRYDQVASNLEVWSKGLRDNFSGMEKVIDFLAFYCVGFKSSMVRDIGILDEDYGMGLFDDDDYCLRALQKGYKIILRKDTYVHHYHRSTWIEKGDNYQKMLEENRQVFIKKHGFDPWDRIKDGDR